MEFTGYDNANLYFNDSSPQPRESLDEIYNAYDSVFEQHPLGHWTQQEKHFLEFAHEVADPVKHFSQQILRSPELLHGLHPEVKNVVSDSTTSPSQKKEQLTKLLFNSLGSANRSATPEFVEDMPGELSDLMGQLYDKDEPFHFNVNEMGEIDAFFQGWDGENVSSSMALRDIPLGRYDKFKDTAFFKENERGFRNMLKYAEENGLKVNIHSHSLGGLTSRLLVDKYPSKSIKTLNMFNAHHSPFRTFKNLPDHIETNYHTIISDITDMKHWFPNKEGNHYYYKGLKNPSELLADHRAEGFEQLPRSSTKFKFAKGFNKAGKAMGVVGLGLTVADMATRIEKDKKSASDVTADVSAVGGGFVAGSLAGTAASAALLAVAPELVIPAMLASFVVGGGVGLGVDEGVKALFHSKNGKPSVVSREVKKVGKFFHRLF